MNQKHQGCRRSTLLSVKRPSFAPTPAYFCITKLSPPKCFPSISSQSTSNSQKATYSNTTPPPKPLLRIILLDLDVQLLEPSRGTSEDVVKRKSENLQKRWKARRHPGGIAFTLSAAGRGEISSCSLLQQGIPHVDVANVGDGLAGTKLPTPLIAACSNEGAGDDISQGGVRVWTVWINSGHIRSSSALTTDWSCTLHRWPTITLLGFRSAIVNCVHVDSIVRMDSTKTLQKPKDKTTSDYRSTFRANPLRKLRRFNFTRLIFREKSPNENILSCYMFQSPKGSSEFLEPSQHKETHLHKNILLQANFNKKVPTCYLFQLSRASFYNSTQARTLVSILHTPKPS